MPQTETPVSQLKINELTKTQFDNASTLSETELYAVDPQFTGGKLLKTDSNGDIIESNTTEESLGDYVTKNTEQDITAIKAFKSRQLFQSGSADGCITIGADALATTVTANTRKLGRMSFHTKASTTLNCSFVSTDTQKGGDASTDVNLVEFGSRPQDATTTSPDEMTFTIAKVHNSIQQADKLTLCQFDKNGVHYYGLLDYNGVLIPTGVQAGGTDLTPDSTTGKVNIPFGTNAVAGLARAGAGLASMAGGVFYIYPSSEAALQAKTNTANPVVPSNLDIAIREGLGNNSLTWTEAYKTSARNTIGAGQSTVTFVDWND